MAGLLCLALESLAILSQRSLLSSGDQSSPRSHSRAALPPVSSLWWHQQPVSALGDALLGWSPVESILCLAPPVLRRGSSSSWVKPFHVGCAVQHSEFAGLAFTFPVWRRGVCSPLRHPLRGCWHLHMESANQGSPNSPYWLGVAGAASMGLG